MKPAFSSISSSSSSTMVLPHRLVILYGMGGLSDCGRHAIRVAIEQQQKLKVTGDANNQIDSITVVTPNPELLDEQPLEGKVGQPNPFSDEEKKAFTLVSVQNWKTERETIKSHFKDATAVISCLGNRQPTFMNVKPESWCSYEGNQVVIEGMKEHSIQRAVVLSSMGINEDWPPAEFHWAGKIMSVIFTIFARKAYKDLADMEKAYRAAGDTSDLDYLLVRPVGIPEDKLPDNEWHIQTAKYKDTNLSIDLAKMDVARYMIEEALHPTRHKDAVVLGGVVKEEAKEPKNEEL